MGSPKPAWTERQVMVFEGQHDTHIKTGEDYQTLPLSGFWSMPPSAARKDRSLAFVPSTYCGHDGRKHEAQRERGQFVALVGDVDKGDHSQQQILDALTKCVGASAHLIYSSAHAREGNMRWRMILPLAEPVVFADWYDAQVAFFDAMGSIGIPMDYALARAGQPVYLPNVPDQHAASGTALRGADGKPLFYTVTKSDLSVDGLVLDRGPIADAIKRLQDQREADERKREELREQARRRAATRSTDETSPIDAFNRGNSLPDLLLGYGYEQSPRNRDDWRSPHQTSGSYATRIISDKWVSLSGSDAAAGVGETFKDGCFGDAYDLFVHYEHGGDNRAAWGAACREYGIERSRPTQPFKVVAGTEADPSAAEPDLEPDEHDDEQEPPRRRRSAPAADLAEPVDLWANYEAPPMPMGLLPDLVERFAVKHGATMGVDPAGLAMAVLTVCAATITDRIKLQVKRHDPTWRESARLWVGLVGAPSMKKTPILTAATRPLKRIDANLMRSYSEKMGAYDALPTAERKMAKKPPQERRIIADATPEAAQEILKDSPRGVLSVQDELSGWFGQMDKYAPGKGSMADRGFWLQAFNGGTYNLARVTRGSCYIPNCSVSVLGGIQPAPLRAIANDTQEDGLIQRFLPVILRPGRVGLDVPADDVVIEYERLIEKLERMAAPPRSGAIGYADDGDQPLHFDDRARTLREALEAKFLGLMRSLETVSPKLSAHFGKYDGLFARLCVLWHCIENADALHPPAEIGLGTAQRVSQFMEQFLQPNAIAFYAGVLGLSDGHDALMDLASLIASKQLSEVKPRDAQSSTQSLRHLTANDIRLLCEKLEAFGWLTREEPGPRSSTPRWMVNPRVHDLFEERGRVEAERREAARNTLKEALQGAKAA